MIVVGEKDPLEKQLEIVQRAYSREKKRRKCAEKILEDKSRTLYLSQQELTNTTQALSIASDKLENQTELLSDLAEDYDRVTKELAYAARIQKSLLPNSVSHPGFCATGQLKPAQFIAGDGYDFFNLRDDILSFYILDVAGHGIAAAMTSFAIQIQLNPKLDGICQKHLADSKNIEEAVSNTILEINHIFYHEHRDSQYFTMIYGLIDLNTGRVTFAQAGHPPPIQCSVNSGKAIPHGKGGTPVAMFDKPSFGIYHCNMEPGDKLCIYSDGITECRNKHDEEFGDERLINLLERHAHRTIKETTDSVIAEICTWNGGEIFEDDLSVLIIEYKSLDVEHSTPSDPKLIYSNACKLSNLTKIQQEIEIFLSDCYQDDITLNFTTLAIIEAMANTFEHGFQSIEISDPEIRITISKVAQKVTATIKDSGDTIPKNVLEQMSNTGVNMPSTDVSNDDLPVSGWGLNLINSATSSVRYYQIENLNHLELTFDCPEHK